VTRGRQVVRARTENWSQIQQYSLWPEQVEYELIRQCVLFNESADQRARETGIPARTISRRVKRFREEGMLSLFDQEPARTPDPERSLPDEMRQLIVNLRAEVPTMSLPFVRWPRYASCGSVASQGTIVCSALLLLG
jgi:hypothetical protein